MLFDRIIFTLLVSMRALFLVIAPFSLGMAYYYAINADLNQAGIYLFFAAFTGLIGVLLTPIINQERSLRS